MMTSTCTHDVNATSCICTRYFTGPTCLTLDLRKPRKSVKENGIYFIYAADMVLENYWYMFARHPLRSSRRLDVVYDRINMTIATEIQITGMRADKTEYIVCIYHINELGERLDSIDERSTARVLLNATLPNCGVLETAYDSTGAYSLAFIGISVTLCVVVVTLFVMHGTYDDVMCRCIDAVSC